MAALLTVLLGRGRPVRAVLGELRGRCRRRKRIGHAVVNCGNRAQVGVDRLQVLVAHLPVIGPRHRRRISRDAPM